MADTDEILRRLIHDVRSPLAVADGYLRLVRGGRLTAADDRDKALDMALQSLQRIGDICQLADFPSPVDLAAPAPRVAAHALTSRLSALCVSPPAQVEGTVSVGTSLDRMVTVLGHLVEAGSMAVVSDSGHLRVTGRAAADPGSLAILTATRRLNGLGARVVHEGDHVSVIFTVEPDRR